MFRGGGPDDALDELDNPTHGHQVVGLFNQLPNRRDYADYYLIIQRPIVRRSLFSFRYGQLTDRLCAQSLKEIRKKVNTGGYHNLNEFKEDMSLMFSNAMTYNEPGSVSRFAAPDRDKAFLTAVNYRSCTRMPSC